MADSRFVSFGKLVIADKVAAFNAGNLKYQLTDSPHIVDCIMCEPGPTEEDTVLLQKLEDKLLTEAGFGAHVSKAKAAAIANGEPAYN